MAYPNVASWSALKDSALIPIDGEQRRLLTVDCGFLTVPSGELVICDPFAMMRQTGNPSLQIPPGRHRVVVTQLDLSESDTEVHRREAYATLLLDEHAQEASRRIITPYLDGSTCPPEFDEEGNYDGIPVDAGTACFVDAQSLAVCMPDESIWYEEIFESSDPNCWFTRMDDPGHIADGLANILLPKARQEENIILVHTGWGDGVFPIVGGYDASGRV